MKTLRLLTSFIWRRLKELSRNEREICQESAVNVAIVDMFFYQSNIASKIKHFNDYSFR